MLGVTGSDNIDMFQQPLYGGPNTLQFFQLRAITHKNIGYPNFQFFDKKCWTTGSAAQVDNYPTRPIWVILAFHIGIHVYMILDICYPSV